MELSPSPPNSLKHSWKLLFFFISINWSKLVAQWMGARKIYSKMHPVSRTNTRRDITDLVNHVTVKTTKTWISSERNIKKKFHMWLRWHIMRSYHCVAGVTFNCQKCLCSLGIQVNYLTRTNTLIWKYVTNIEVWNKQWNKQCKTRVHEHTSLRNWFVKA